MKTEEFKALIDEQGDGLDLRGVDLRGCNLRGISLVGLDLRGVDLRGVNLRGVNLRGVDLRGVDLRGVDLRGVDLSRAVMGGIMQEKRYIKVGRHGNHHYSTDYNYDDDMIRTGTFEGSLEEFELYINSPAFEDEHKELEAHRALIAYIKALRVVS